MPFWRLKEIISCEYRREVFASCYCFRQIIDSRAAPLIAVDNPTLKRCDPIFQQLAVGVWYTEGEDEQMPARVPAKISRQGCFVSEISGPCTLVCRVSQTIVQHRPPPVITAAESLSFTA